MTSDKIRNLLANKDKRDDFFEGIITFRSTAYLDATYIVYPEKVFVTFPIEGEVLQKIKKYFFDNKAFYRFKKLLEKTKLTLPLEIYEKLHILCKERNLLDFEIYLGIMIALASTENLSNKGRKSTVDANMKELISVIYPTQNNESENKQRKYYYLRKLSFDFIDNATRVPKPITFIGKEFLDDHDFQMYIEHSLKILIKMYIEIYVPKLNLNTNILFCQSFYNFIDKETPYSYSASKVLKADILRLFIEIYKLSGYNFNKDNSIASIELDTVETWLKTKHN